jgi:K+-transporting ATPase A subunit
MSKSLVVFLYAYLCVDDKEQVNAEIGTFNNNVNFISNRACQHYKADNEKTTSKVCQETYCHTVVHASSAVWCAFGPGSLRTQSVRDTILS